MIRRFSQQLFSLFRQLRQVNRELIYDLTQAVEGLRGESRTLVRAVSRTSETKDRTTEELDRSSDRKRR